MPSLTLSLCLIALVVMIVQFLCSPATIPQAIAVAAIVVLSLLIELGFRLFNRQSAKA